MSVLFRHDLGSLNVQNLMVAIPTSPPSPEAGVGVPGPMAFLITGLCLSIGCFLIGRFYSRIKRRPLLAKLAYVLMLLVAIATSVGASWAMKQQRRRALRDDQVRQISPVRNWRSDEAIEPESFDVNAPHENTKPVSE